MQRIVSESSIFIDPLDVEAMLSVSFPRPQRSGQRLDCDRLQSIATGCEREQLRG